MPGLVVLASLLLLLTHAQQPAPKTGEAATGRPPASKQLLAVRGQVLTVKSPSKGLLIIAIRPAKEFAEVSVTARENDLVGRAVGGTGDSQLFGLLTGDAPEDETITAV